MKLEVAEPIARRIRDALAPHCERIEIAGSIRRRKPEVGDIEIVAIPKTHKMVDLFGNEVSVVRDQRFIETAAMMGRVMKGNIATGRYIAFETLDGIDLDLFTAHRDNWGLILAIRTGSADFSHRTLASGWVRAGFHSMDGMLCSKFHKVAVREERDLFGLIGIKWVDPEGRI